MIVTGGKIYDRCLICGKLVRITGWFARWHICLDKDERNRRRRAMGWPDEDGSFEHSATSGTIKVKDNKWKHTRKQN